MTMSTWVYGFGGGGPTARAKMRDLLGGKGANLAEMSSLGLPVPPGFTITTEVCTLLLRPRPALSRRTWRSRSRGAAPGRGDGSAPRFGDPERPLLVSVRSGAPVSMPGMMDTVLNLGLNDGRSRAWRASTGDRALRLRQLPPLHPDVRRRGARRRPLPVRGPARGRQAAAAAATSTPSSPPRTGEPGRGLSGDRRRSSTGKPFPQDVEEQLWGAIGAVFGSWMTPRAVTYRRLHDIDDDMGTAVNVQAMVFGNMGERLRHRRRLHPQPVDRREALLRRVPGQRPGRGRGRRHPHAAAADHRHEGGDRRQPAGDGRGDARGLRRARARCSTGSRRTTATCRTSSSPSRRASSRCCRPAAASAPPRRR